MKMRNGATFLVAFGLAASACAQMVLEVADPPFRVSIPSLPAMTLDDHPLKAAKPHLRLFGSSGAYNVSVLVPTADPRMTALDCASSIISQLSQRPGVPPQDRIYKARIDSNTYIAIYASAMPAAVQLHAHLMSAAGNSHCIEVHASKVAMSPDEVRPWLTGFSEARIEPAR